MDVEVSRDLRQSYMAKSYSTRTWEYSSSVMMTQELVGGSMYPLTIKGLEEGMGELSK